MRPSARLVNHATRAVLRRLSYLEFSDETYRLERSSWQVGRNTHPLLSASRQLGSSRCTGSFEIGKASQSEIDRQSKTFESSKAQQFRGFLGCGDGDEDSGLSRQHKESRVIGYPPEKLFAVVAAVDLYEDFVPWCQRSVVLRREGEEILDAELEVGFKFFVERYVSHIELERPTLIKTSVSQSSLFDYLINVWEFKPGPIPGSCNLHFFVDFKFRSPLYRGVANMFFNEVVSRLVSSFEDRCNTVYGPGIKVLEDPYGNQAAS